jgi:ATP/maltotriose-dependent transcriptional regulator MalT
MLETGTADRRLRASALARASRLAWRQLDYASTQKLLEESLTIDRDLGDPLRVARRLRSLAMVAMAQGHFDEAERLCEESLSIFRDHGDQYGLSLALAFLGLTLHLAGDHERADPCVQEALELSRATGNLLGGIYSLAGVSFGAIATGDMANLRALGPETAHLLRTLGGVLEDPGWLWTSIAFASGEGRYRSALRLAGAVEERARQDGVHFHEQFRRYMLPWLERARARVGPAEAARLTVEGSQMTLEELIEEGLREPDAKRGASLSPRELEIADLIADGLTNGEIAQRLVISRRTVESHVDHIKAKLGFARRARIMAWVLNRENDVDTSA